jgi:hypothetical protein
MWVDRHVMELKKWLILLTVNDLLVAVNNLKALFQHIHALICAMAHGEDTLEHLQEARVGDGGGGDTIAVGSASKSHSWRRRGSPMSYWILQNCRAKQLMCNILIELLKCHHLNHALNIWSKSTRYLWVDDNVPYLIHDVVKHIKPLMLYESI